MPVPFPFLNGAAFTLFARGSITISIMEKRGNSVLQNEKYYQSLSSCRVQFVSLKVFRESHLRRPPLSWIAQMFILKGHIFWCGIKENDIFKYLLLELWNRWFREVEVPVHQKTFVVYAKLFLNKMGLSRLSEHAGKSCLRSWNERYSEE